MTLYLVSAVVVLVFSGLLAMAGLGAAFLFVPFFYYLGVPLSEATAAGLFLNAISLSFASVVYWRERVVNVRVALPVLLVAIILSPIGARVTPFVDKNLLLTLFAAFLVFAGCMMLFFKPKQRDHELNRAVEVSAGAGVGGVAGFLGGLLGVGGGNFIVPVLNWLGLDPKIAAGTTALVVVFSSLSGFLGHISLGGLDPAFLVVTAVMAAVGSFTGARLMTRRLSSAQLKMMIGILLWLIAAKMIFDLVR